MSNRFDPNDLEQFTQQYDTGFGPITQQKTTNFNVKGVRMKSVKRSLSGADAVDKIDEITEDIRKNINTLLLFNNTLCGAKHLDIAYEDQSEKYESILQKTNDLERSANEQDPSTVRNYLEQIADQIELEISNTNYIFPKIIYSSIHIRNFVQSIYSQIGHEEYKQEARVAINSMLAIERFLQLDDLSAKEGVSIDVAIRTISLLNEMAQYKQEVIKLKELDRQKSRQTTRMVLSTMFFIILALVAAILTVSLVGVSWINSKEFILPVIGVPLAVIIWGFIGSFASMLYRFNRRPIHDFGDTIKWLITRPVQGIVLSSAFYLVLISGQFLFTGEVGATGEGVLNSTEIILFLSFLLGFSDRFGDSVFEALVQKYSGRIAGDHTTNKQSPPNEAPSTPTPTLPTPPPKPQPTPDLLEKPPKPTTRELDKPEEEDN